MAPLSDTNAPPAKGMSGWREHLLVMVLFVLLVFLFTLPFSLRLHREVVSSHVDNLLNVWIMSWDAHAVTTHPAALFQANMNHPSPDSLAFSEHLFILAMLAAPVNWVTGNPVLAYNLVALLGFALCGYTMYLLARYLAGSRLCSLAAGIFFAFVPYHFSTIVHVHVSLYLFQPLIILMLFRYFDGGGRRYLAGLGAAFLAQALLGWYQLAFSSIPIGLFLLWKVLSPRRREHAGAILRALGVLALCMLLVLPFALPYFRLHREIPEEEREPAINVIAHASAQDFLRVLPQNYLYGKLGLFSTGNPGEGNALFPGFLVFPLLLLALLSVLRNHARSAMRERGRRGGSECAGESEARGQGSGDGTGNDRPRDSRRGYFLYFAVLGLTCFVLSLGPQPHGIPNLPYKLLHKLPIYGFVRFPTRYHIMVILSLAVMIAYGCSHLQGLLERRRGRTLARAAVAAVAVLMLLEFAVVGLPRTAVAVGDAVPRVYRELAEAEGAVVAEVPMPLVDNSVVFEDPLTLNYGTLDNTFLSALREQDATYFSTYNWKKLLNGMSGYYPLFYRRSLVEMASFPSPRSLDFLRGAGVNHLVVKWEYYPPERRGEVREELEGSPGVALVDDYPEGLSLYRLQPLETAPAAGLDIRLAVPGLAMPGRPLSASLSISNPGPLPFLNLDERRQPVEASWRDDAGELARRESSYFYCPFFIAGEEGAPAPFQLTAPERAGEYTLNVRAKSGVLEGWSWEARVAVGDAASVESAGELEGALEYAVDLPFPHGAGEKEEGLDVRVRGPSGAPFGQADHENVAGVEAESGPGGAPPLPVYASATPERERGGVRSDAHSLPHAGFSRAGEEGVPALPLRAGICFPLALAVHNGSDALWERQRPGVAGAVAVTARWTRDGDPRWEMVQQALLPCDLAPGQEEAFPALLQAPFEEGEYSLTLRLNCLGIAYIGEELSLRVKVTGWSASASIHGGGSL